MLLVATLAGVAADLELPVLLNDGAAGQESVEDEVGAAISFDAVLDANASSLDATHSVTDTYRQIWVSSGTGGGG